MGSVISIKGVRDAPKSSQNKMETKILSAEEIVEWKIPPFQRPLRVNQKVLDLAEEMKSTEQIQGVITLGRLGRDTYIIDGQHRIEGFRLSELKLVLADVRLLTVDSMAEMSEEFVYLNSSLVKMRPDDILRGLEGSIPAIATIRKACDFVGYDMVRRNGSTSAMLSMSVLLRCWSGSSGETPTANSSGKSASSLAQSMNSGDVQSLTAFLQLCHSAWGRDPEYFRLWGALNLTICMWLWRRLVIDRDRPGGKRYAILTHADFKQCLMSLSADGDYLNWLPGRNMSDRDRSPCWSRIKAIFVRRLTDIRGDKKKALLPQPVWASK